MGNAQLQQKLQLFIAERRRVYEAMIAVVRMQNINSRPQQPYPSAVQAWNDLQAEYDRIEQDIRDVSVLLERYLHPE